MTLINYVEIDIWGRTFSLPVEYDCYAGESVTNEQIVALKQFVEQPKWIEVAKAIVEDYCRNHVMEDIDNNKKSNIFSYVKPEYLFVKRDRTNPRVMLMCKYRYDLEHGLTVVFSHDGKIIVGSQDIIL